MVNAKLQPFVISQTRNYGTKMYLLGADGRFDDEVLTPKRQSKDDGLRQTNSGLRSGTPTRQKTDRRSTIALSPPMQRQMTDGAIISIGKDLQVTAME